MTNVAREMSSVMVTMRLKRARNSGRYSSLPAVNAKKATASCVMQRKSNRFALGTRLSTHGPLRKPTTT